ncbi:3-methyl-2-oxobutanoate hydroxymethyltransferase [Seminavis robusta]|uniref:3-methyl-2-oxobutanoate hydroxymethyltransferase n=1 Tax=Seminavis robusta TaxID=568900 RepID=A0A9N8D8G9_9STRA|nr:3-methyl-2-oxobutanoate hydroxymethyltransferase [Seminavis robusta]|eukprot:Sro1_g000740.1 3-methyl-2-oxobutanoate hydroxymethyltransferase (358) ;mRNA; r:205844-207124
MASSLLSRAFVRSFGAINVPNHTKTFATKVSALSLASKKRKGRKISMVTAYDYPSAVHCARAEIDIILVGDSVAMVELGYDTTQPVTVDQMIHHCQSVKRGVEQSNANTTPLLVGDMPFGSYEFEDTDVALRNAYKFVKEAGVDAVKMEGGSPARARTAKMVVDGGVAVMGHIGLTPQAISVIGGFRAQGRTASRARALLDDAMRLQDAGAFSVVLECVPANVAEAITETLEIPTIGIGAGGYTSGQVLVYHDMLGMLSHPHHEQFMPKFCKQYAEVGHAIQSGLQEFKADVESGTFPSDKYSPYVMTEKERMAFDALLKQDEDERKRKHDEAAVKMTAADEYEQLSLYGQDNSSKK